MPPAKSVSTPALLGFLVASIAVVTLVGMMGSSLATVPLQRAMAREITLDQAVEAARSADPAAALERLRGPLAESAAAVLAPGPDIEARIAAERRAMRTRLAAESAEAGTRMKVMIGVVGAMAAAFGAGMLMAASRRA